DVVLVTAHQHPVDPGRPRDDQALPEDLSRVTPAAVLWQDGITDVAAPLDEKVVEPEPDRCPADDLPRHLGGQEDAWHVPRRQVAPLPVILQFPQVGAPRLPRLVPQAEREAVGGHSAVPGGERRLVLLAQRTEAQRLHRRALNGDNVVLDPGVHRARLASGARDLHLSFRGAPPPADRATRGGQRCLPASRSPRSASGPPLGDTSPTRCASCATAGCRTIPTRCSPLWRATGTR